MGAARPLDLDLKLEVITGRRGRGKSGSQDIAGDRRNTLRVYQVLNPKQQAFEATNIKKRQMAKSFQDCAAIRYHPM